MRRRHVVPAIAVLILALGSCGLLYYVTPPTDAEVQFHFDQWRRATEAGDWHNVWVMLGPPSPMIEPQTWWRAYGEDQAGFLRERQASYPGLARQVRLQSLHRMTHVDDPYTFMARVHIDYADPHSSAVQATNDVYFYLTKRDGNIRIWGFSTQAW